MFRLEYVGVALLAVATAIAVAYPSRPGTLASGREAANVAPRPAVHKPIFPPQISPPRLAPHSGSLSTFYSPEYGFSFRYPRTYPLEEGDIVEHSFFLKRQRELDQEKPNAKLVVTVLVPEDAHPNTNFLFGSLQVVAAPSMHRESCGEKGWSLPADDAGEAAKRVQIEDPRWEAFQSAFSTAGTAVLAREYSTFAQETCYEVSLVVATEQTDDAGTVRQADVRGIVGQLEKVILGFHFFLPAERNDTQ